MRSLASPMCLTSLTHACVRYPFVLLHVCLDLHEGLGRDLTDSLARDRRIELAADRRSALSVNPNRDEDLSFHLRENAGSVDRFLGEGQLLDGSNLIQSSKVVDVRAGGAGDFVLKSDGFSVFDDAVRGGVQGPIA